MRTAVITLASQRRRLHLERQEAWLRQVDDDHVRIVVVLDEVGDLPTRGTAVRVPPGADGLRLAAARNRGAQEAIERGAELLCFLDVDCLPHPDLLPLYAAAASQDTALLAGPVTYLPQGVVPSAPASAGPHLSPHPARPNPTRGSVERASADGWNLFWSLSFACTARTWETIGGFDERYEGYGGEDTDFALTARAAGAELLWVGGAHALHQHHAVSAPPWEHLDDVLRNGALFADTWGYWPMGGWLDAFSRAGAIERVDGGWRRTVDAVGAPVRAEEVPTEPVTTTGRRS